MKFMKIKLKLVSFFSLIIFGSILVNYFIFFNDYNSTTALLFSIAGMFITVLLFGGMFLFEKKRIKKKK